MKLFDIISYGCIAITGAALAWHNLSVSTGPSKSGGDPVREHPSAPIKASYSQPDDDAGQRADEDVDSVYPEAMPEIMFGAPPPPPKSWGVAIDTQYKENSEAIGDTSSPEIYFGKALDDGALIEVVALNRDGVNSLNGLCTGTLIAPRMVLTARHCIREGIKKMLVGDSASAPTHIYDIEGAANAHSTSAPRDVAVVLLTQDVQDVMPAVIAPSVWITQARWIGVAGYGLDETHFQNKHGKKLFAAIPVASSDCAGADVAGQSQSDYYGCIPGAEMIAKGIFTSGELDRIEKRARELIKRETTDERRVDTCKGDSGAGAFIPTPAEFKDTSEFTNAVMEKRYLAGVTSRVIRMKSELKLNLENDDGEKYMNCGDGGIYVRIDGDVLLYIKQAASFWGQEVSVASSGLENQ